MTRSYTHQEGGREPGSLNTEAPNPAGSGTLGSPPSSPGLLFGASTVPPVPSREVQAWFGPGFLAPLVHVSGHDLTPNIVWREQHGGRKYPTHLPSYKGPVVISEKRWRTARRPGGLLLSAISRSHRPDFPAPKGSIFIDVDIDQCFPSILAAASGSDLLAEACQGDLHQVSGDLMAPNLDQKGRRALGKLFNLSAIGGITRTGWRKQLKAAGIEVTAHRADYMLSTWWGSFPRAEDFRDAWLAWHQEAARENRGLQVVLPGGRAFFFGSVAVVGDVKSGYAVRSGTPKSRLSAAMRTTWCSLFRGVESVILDRALQLIYPLRERGLRLVLPMYDGLLLQVPEGDAEVLASAVQKLFRQALTEVGVPATVSTQLKRSWAG